jgi:hypothetical protein
MAVRKTTTQNTPTATPTTTPKTQSPRTSRVVNISDQYDVKLIANTEHLRSASTSSTPTVSRSSSVVSGSFRERFGSAPAPYDPNKSRATTIGGGGFGSVRRTASIAGTQSGSYVPTRQSSIGLWSATRPDEEETPEEPEEPEDNMIMNFGNDGAKDAAPSKENIPPLAQSEKGSEDVIENDGEDEVAPLGLWGSPRPPGVAELNREIAPKRRWTVNESTQT